ncbi:hypothetical protein B9Z55_003299 [Caenorhabditis nigoni]|nr:hypothetical protein B9Z55_003299 [Caenorhabditis nigoni]
MPFVVQKMLIDEMLLDDRMFLSFTSKRTCRLLGMSKLYAGRALSIKATLNTDLNSDGVEVRIENEDKWTFFIPYDKSDLENVVCWKIDGSDVRVSHEVKEIGTEIKKHTVSIVEGAGLKQTRKLLEPLGKLLRHLTSFLNFDSLHCICHTLPNGLISQLECSLNYTKIWIRREFWTLHGWDSEDRAAVVTPKELEVLLSKIKSRELKLNVKVASAVYKYRKHPESIGGGKIQKLILQSHTWVDFSDLPAARAISFPLKVQSREINTLLKSWVAGKNREMEILDFEIGEFTDRTRNFFFTGITQHETQLTVSDRERFLTYAFSFDLLSDVIAVDIIREGDGMRATVIEAMLWPPLENNWNRVPYSKRTMFVIVWSEKNLKKARGEYVDNWF